MDSKIKSFIKKHSIWQHISVVMLMWWLISTVVTNSIIMISNAFNIECEFPLSDLIFDVCYVYKICITDFVYLVRGDNPQLDNIQTLTALAVIIASCALVFLATRIYKPSAKTAIKIFLFIVLVDFVASILFMVDPLWLALSLRAVLMLMLLLSLGVTANRKE